MPRKLTARDKQEIIVLYKNTDETTNTLASKYGMASSSISRLLKKSLSTEEYNRLVQEKRLARNKDKNSKDKDTPTQSGLDPFAAIAPENISALAPIDIVAPLSTESAKPSRASDMNTESLLTEVKDLDDELIASEYKDIKESDVISLEEMLGKEVADLYDDDEEDYSEEENGDLDTPKDIEKPILKERTKIEILPLNTASLPKYCYVVVNRWSELISRPLKDFSDLGDIPADESQQPTMPVFDNHRVAKRFLVNSQRVVKVPNSNMLLTTSRYLIAKGITRILLDGQVFTL